MNKSVTKYIFPYSSFHAEHDGDIYFHVQQLLRKLEGLLQPHVSLFIPPPSPVLSQYIPFYEVRRNIKMIWTVRAKKSFHLVELEADAKFTTGLLLLVQTRSPDYA